MHLAVQNQLRNQGRIEQNFHRRAAPFARFARNQALRNKAFQVERQIGQKLGAALFGEKVDDAVKRLVGIIGVQRCHAQMPRFGKRQRVVHRFAVADFTNQNHIGGLAQGVFQRGKPVLRVHAHFALRNNAVFVRVHIFNRVFNGDDVSVAVFVAVVNHRRERGGFARACAAHKNHQAAFFHHHVF